MKSELLALLSNGAKSESELSAIYSPAGMSEVVAALEELESWGIVKTRSRQIHEGHNVFHWDCEYRLCRQCKI